MTSPIESDSVRVALQHLHDVRNADHESRIRAAQELVGATLRAHRRRLPRSVIRRLITEIRDVLGHDDPTSATAAVPSHERGPERCPLCKTTLHWRLSPERWSPWVCQTCHPCPHPHDRVEWTVEAQP